MAPRVASALVLADAILRLFPIAAIGMFTGLPRRAAAICIAAVGGLFAAYAAATFRDIQTIERVLPQDDEYAFRPLLCRRGDLRGDLRPGSERRLSARLSSPHHPPARPVGISGRALPIATLIGVLLTLWLPSEWTNVPVLDMPSANRTR
jgi:hypothetical protein